MVTCAFIFAVLFNSVRTAQIASSLLHMVTVVGAGYLTNALHGASDELHLLASFVPSFPFLAALQNICQREASGKGANFSNWFVPVSGKIMIAEMFSMFGSEMTAEFGGKMPNMDASDIPLTLGDAIVMMAFDTMLYFWIALWLDGVWQGTYGRAQSWFFVCRNCKRRRKKDTRESLTDALEHAQTPSAALELKNLTKRFGDKEAVSEMSFSAHYGEIFALLGHNGAGKTTTINCLTGMLPPTSGTAMIDGFPLENTDACRQSLSICPQENPFYKEFTCEEHLRFFSALRGCYRSEDTFDEVLDALGLREKRLAKTAELSGGQQRRLWVATALLNDAPVVFLDEPTSGMDPASRRDFWSLLDRMRMAGRCIIFTTHYLEEADVVADRKAIVAKGKLCAIGTSRELKQKFGLGYHLTVQHTKAYQPIKQLVDEVVPGAPMRLTQEAVIFTIPTNLNEHVATILEGLERGKERLGITEYGLQMTTLEEVFTRIGDEAHSERLASFKDPNWARQGPREYAPKTWWRAVGALCRIRFLGWWRDSRSFARFVMPMIIQLVSAMSNNTKHDPEQAQMLAEMGWAKGVYEGSNFVMFSAMAFTTLVINFCADATADRVNRTKLVSIAQGLSASQYWAGTLIPMYVLSLVISVYVPLLAWFLDVSPFLGTPLPVLFAVAVFYPLSLLLWSQWITGLSKCPDRSRRLVPMVNMTLSFGAVMMIAMTYLAQKPGWGDFFHWVFCFTLPTYNLQGCMIQILRQDKYPSAFDYFGSLAVLPLFGSIVQSCWLSGLLVLSERPDGLCGGCSSALQRICQRVYWRYQVYRGQVPGTPAREVELSPLRPEFESGRSVLEEIDVDVVEERRAAEASYFGTSNPNEGEGAIAVRELKVTYKSGWFRPKTTHAVRGISVAIRRGDCFGLLGPNGAGKTSTMAVLTGEIRPTSGNVRVLGGTLESAFPRIGFCPQYHPLWATCTGRDHLLFYGRMKGIKEEELGAWIDVLLQKLGLSPEDADKVSKNYSGGMKRKLAIGIALISLPEIMYLDEPTAGVDAGSKRGLWDLILNRRPEQTVILTTHQMAEAEALCNRLAIQVNGRLQCIGTPLHICSKYGQGYRLEIVKAPHRDEFEMGKFVQSICPGTTLHESRCGLLSYDLPIGGAMPPLSTVFSRLSQHAADAGIADFSISQPTLDQVFLHFARQQRAIDEGPPHVSLDAPVLV